MQKTLMAMILGACFALAPATVMAEAQSGEVVLAVSERDSVETTVSEIDKVNRNVTLKFANGEEVALLAVPAEITRLDSLNVGDKVTVKASDTLAILLIKGGSGVRAIIDGEGYQRTADGAGRVMTRRIRSDIVAVDQQAQTVTVKNLSGELQTIKVQNEATLRNAAKGDQAEVIMRTSVAIWAK
ncbi:hypothetical protein [Chitinilyticum litopenaei]|uniref:hypothetical protein n=1 Tax=Chitinilyticum litopenaei TaxID=1121276 RepID=UPI000421EC27|nr:hypothetical protein [Chitinilyticum litopenaei]